MKLKNLSLLYLSLCIGFTTISCDDDDTITDDTDSTEETTEDN